MNNSPATLIPLLNKASGLISRGLHAEAKPCCEKLFKIAPNDIRVILQCGRLLYGQRQFPAAAELLEKGFKLKPNDPGIRIMLFASYKDAHNYEQFIRVANLFIHSSSDVSELALAFTAYLDVCDWISAERIEAKVINAAKSGKVETALFPAILLTSNGLTNITPDITYQLHRQWGKIYAKGIKLKPPRKINGRIRVAYISGDFRRHAVGFFMLQIIASHHRNEFEVFCYAHMNGLHDDVTDMFIQNADHFIDITEIDDRSLVTRMRKDRIHIAVDLSSHTINSRTPAFALRLAPIQISYLGYPNTTGLQEMDYHITDHFAEDLEHGTKYSEELLFMPKSFLCYGMEWTEDKKPTAPCEERGFVTFASFNDSRKLNLNVIKIWSAILQRVETSRLLLKFIGSGNSLIQNNVYAAFASFGIGKDRIELLNRTATISDHILSYHQVDILLDPFPYTGTTTTCEALSQGVPVITLVGPTHSNRVSYSILKNIGFEETIAHSTEEYIEKAVQFANNPKGLSILRTCLPMLLQHSPLRQTDQFTYDLEALYKKACEKKGITLKLSTNPSDQLQTAKTKIRKLHIGGKKRDPEWEILDAIPSKLTDHVGNANDLSAFEDNTFDAIYSSHVLEHFSYQKELANVLKEWYRVIKPGGILYASVPDLEVLCQLFLMKETLCPQDRFMVMRMIFGGQIDPYDFHKVGYNEEILSTFLSNAGFRDIEKHADFGLFHDTSTMMFNDTPISLNLTAIK